MSVEDEVKIELQASEIQHIAPSPNGSTPHVGIASIIASIISTFLIRVAARTSFVILSFYVGKESESATLVVVVIEAYYITELLLAPLVGVLSDRKGRKPYMLYAPIVAALATLVMAVTSFVFPTPHLKASEINLELITIVLLILAARLLEGTSAALNAPANLGYLADTTVGNDKLRVRVLTGYQVATIAGLALAIPFGGQVWGLLGRAGFFVAIAIYALCFLVIAVWMKESLSRVSEAENHGSVKEYRQILGNKRIFTFVPAWLAINAMLGAWLSLILIILAYPTARCHIKADQVVPGLKSSINTFATTFCALEPGQVDADKRFPNQLLHGGFLPTEASALVGVYGVLFIVGMGLWTIIVPKLRRTTVMVLSLFGLVLTSVTLIFVNGLGDNPLSISPANLSTLWLLLPLVLIGILATAGFTPAALTHLAAIAETLPGKRGAVMGLYSVLLGIGQLIGVFIGGLFVDWEGFNGLMYYSLILACISLGSVMYMRSHRHDIDDHLTPAPALT